MAEEYRASGFRRAAVPGFGEGALRRVLVSVRLRSDAALLALASVVRRCVEGHSRNNGRDVASKATIEVFVSGLITHDPAFSAIQRETAVTSLRGAKRTDSAISQLCIPEITTVRPAISPR